MASVHGGHSPRQRAADAFLLWEASPRGPEGGGQCASAFSGGMPGIKHCSGIGGMGKWGGPERLHHEVSWILLTELCVACTAWALEPDAQVRTPVTASS